MLESHAPQTPPFPALPRPEPSGPGSRRLRAEPPREVTLRPVSVTAAAILSCAVLACPGGCAGERPETGGPAAVAPEFTRVLELEVDPPEGRVLRVENLVGSFRVLPGEGERVRIRVTAHAGTEEGAGKLALEEIPGGGQGDLVVRVAYPVDEHPVYRYGEGQATGSMWFDLVGGGRRSTGLDYGGKHVTISNGKGAPLYANVEVLLPGREVNAEFENQVGDMTARDVAGTLSFSTRGGSQHLESVTGEVSISSATGDVTVEALQGSLSCTTATGRVVVKEFHGESMKLSTATGDVEVEGGGGGLVEVTTATGGIDMQGASADRVVLSTATGNITSLLGGMQRFKADSGSGSILFTSESAGLKQVEATTVGGGIRLGLGEGLAFSAKTHAPGGRLESRLEDAEPVVEDGRIVGYRRGEGGAELNISTGHGDISLAPIH